VFRQELVRSLATAGFQVSHEDDPVHSSKGTPDFGLARRRPRTMPFDFERLGETCFVLN
jgi:hypothetical protein